MRKNILQIFMLVLSATLLLAPNSMAQDPQTSWDIDFETDPPFSPYCWAEAYTFEQADGVLKVNALDHPWDQFVFWARPFNIAPNPFCDFHIKSDVALSSFAITFKDEDAEPQQIVKTFSVPADTNNWTYVFFDLTGDLGSLNTTILAEIQMDPNAAGTIWFDDFRMGEAAKPDFSPPTIDPLEDLLVYKNAGEQSVTISGITDGEPELVQNISVTVSSSNTGIIPHPAKSALQGDSIVLTFTPVADTVGQSYITVKLVDNGTVANTTIDSFLVVVLEDGGTGYVEHFDTNVVPVQVTSLPGHSFEMSDSSLKIMADRSQRWYGFEYNMGAVVNMTDNPYVNVKIKADRDFVLQAFLVDYSGAGYSIELVGSQYVYNELVEGEYYFVQNRIYQGDEFVNVLFDFSDADPEVVDLSRITQVKFVGNGTSLSFDGTFTFDDLALGDQADPLSYIGQIPDQSFYVNSAGTQKILIPEIRNTDTIYVTSDGSLIEDVSVGSITYETFVENYRNETYGYAWLTFSLINDAAGTDTITLTSVGKPGFDNNVCSFLLTVTSNMKPLIDPLDSVVAKVNTEYTIGLSGISDGDKAKEQSINLSAISDNEAVIDTVYLDYTSDLKTGEIKFTAISPGVANITVYVIDDENDTTGVTFKVDAFSSLNAAPVVDQVEKVTVINSAGEQTITLTGIGDGDATSQVLTITAESSNDTILPGPVVNYTQGESTTDLVFTPLTDTAGPVIITVTISDDGGTVDNDGDKTTVMVFELESVTPPVKGYVMDLTMPDALSYFRPEGLNEFYWLDIVDTLGTQALRVKYIEKWTFGGIWFELPQELDLSNMPVVSYDILSVGNESYHWNYFYEVPGSDGTRRRNIQNSGSHQYLIPPDTLITTTYDYRDPGDLNTDEGEPIDPSRIDALLINLHNTLPSWPFTNTSGLVYYSDIRFGDSAVYEEKFPFVTIDEIPDQTAFVNSGDHTITLTGLSNGEGSVDGLAITAVSAAPAYMPDPVVSEINPDGTAELTYIASEFARINITVTVSHTTSNPVELVFVASVIEDDPGGLGNITIDMEDEKQTIRGLGTFENAHRWVDLYANEMGASAVRVGIIENQWEPENDNNDPRVLNMDGFNYDAFNWQYYRDLKAAGVETFILTSWSPPAWMKRNLSESHKEQANRWENTDNILEPYYYDEFAESMVAVVKAFKEEADIDLLALGLQNEPFFNEPYPSAILSGEKFAELITVVGDRFAEEGLDHVGFFMPEQVFSSGWGDYGMYGYLDDLKANAAANAYCDYFAVHGYDQTGVNSGFPSFSGWTTLWEDVQEGDHPKEMWMSETHRSYDDNYDNAIGVALAIHGSLWAGNISLWTNWAFATMQLSNNSPTPIFWISKNYFKYIRPNAVRVSTESDYADVVATAFKNTDGSVSIVAINKGTFSAPIRFVGDNLPEEYTLYRTTEVEECENVGTYHTNDGPYALQGMSVTTFVAESNSILTIDHVADVMVDYNSGESVVNITGISNGSGNVDNLTLAFENDNAGLFSDISVSAIDPGGTAELTFTPATDVSGIAKITLQLSDDSENSRGITFFIIVGEPTNIIEPEKSTVVVYPVPAQEYVNVLVESENFEQIFIRDLSGRILKQESINSNLVNINISDLNEGVYLLELRGNNQRNITKFIVQ